LLDFNCDSFVTHPDEKDNTLLKILVPGESGDYNVGICHGTAVSKCQSRPPNYEPFDNVEALEKIFCTFLALSGVEGLEHAHGCSIISVVESNLEMAFAKADSSTLHY
jgi:hypothetical protein